MTDEQKKKALLDEKRMLEDHLAAIRTKRQDSELKILNRRLSPHDEFSALRKLKLESHREGHDASARLKAIFAELSDLKAKREGASGIEEVASILREILALLKDRDLVLDSPSQQWQADAELPG